MAHGARRLLGMRLGGPRSRRCARALREELGIPIDAVVVGTLRWLVSEKRYEDLIRAAVGIR